MLLLDILTKSLAEHSGKNSFFINGVYYTYKDLYRKITAIRSELRTRLNPAEKIIGLVANDDLETYASILALWYEGKAYVPINPEAPMERNQIIVDEANIRTILSSSPEQNYGGLTNINTSTLHETDLTLKPVSVSLEDFAYILFTSGTTGKPKGVPITFANVTGFIHAFDKLGLDINPTDKCLQMFEMTFDLSIMSYLIPLIKGACVCTIPKGKIKFNYIFELIDEHGLSVALMVPSILHYLRPYFDEIKSDAMRYSLFCGEALSKTIIQEWARCIPNAEIYNVYGPTEATIFCTAYTFHNSGVNKSHHDILSIGKAMSGTDTIIVDHENNLVPPNTIGELCLGGIQLTPGYWNNPEKNKTAFFTSNIKNKQQRFYKTGDLVIADDEGDIMYVGRTDSQIKVQGYRVELSEIEFHCKSYLQKINAVAIPFENNLGNTEIGLAIEAASFDAKGLTTFLKTKIPAYMIPTQIIFEETLPLNSNGKIDRNALKKHFK